MKTLGFLLLFIIPLDLYGQEDKSFTKDLNKDGFIDTIKSSYDGGSGFGGIFVKTINGKTSEEFELNNFGCFCSIKKIILIPPGLMKESNRPFLNAIKDELLPPERNGPEGSLQWIISAWMSYKMLPDNPFYSFLINSPTRWISGKIQLPYTYYIKISGDTINKLYVTDEEFPEGFNKTVDRGILIYYGHNHFRNAIGDSLVLECSTPVYEAYKTSHGVIATKGNYYSWIFLSDYGLTGAPDKLRWESIEKVKIIDRYAIIQQKCMMYSPNSFFIIDIENGLVGKLKLQTDSDALASFEIANGELRISVDYKTQVFELSKLFTELTNIK